MAGLGFCNKQGARSKHRHASEPGGAPSNKAAKQNITTAQTSTASNLSSLPTLSHTATMGHVLQPSAIPPASSTFSTQSQPLHHTYRDPRSISAPTAPHTDTRAQSHISTPVATFTVPQTYSRSGSSDATSHMVPPATDNRGSPRARGRPTDTRAGGTM